MRIALSHVYAWPDVRRGAERYTHELGAALLRAGHDVQIVTTAKQPGSGRELGVPVHRLPRRGRSLRRLHGGLADSVAFGPQSFARLAASRLDVWHAMSTGDAAAASVAARLRPGLRSVYTECGFPSRRSRDARSDHRWYDTTVRWVDEFVCLSEPAGELLARDYGRTARVVPAGVDLRTFRPGGPSYRSPVLLFPGALDEPRKHLDRFLEALALLRRTGRDVQGWLVGPGRRPERLSELAREGLGAVTVERAARSEELPELYRQAWVTVLPSEAEVFGLVVLESMACGTPVVVLDDGLGPSLLVTDNAGVRVAATSEALAEGCLRGLDLARSESTAKACEMRARAFDWDTVVVPRLLSLYRGESP